MSDPNRIADAAPDPAPAVRPRWRGLASALALILACAAPAPALAEPAPQAQRVVALGGTVTEIIHAIGEQGRMVGRDDSSTFPPEARDLPSIGYMRALSPEGVLSVGPDLILAEAHAGPVEALSVLREAGVMFQPVPPGYDAQAMAARIEAVATALGRPERAAPLVAELRADLARAEAAAATRTQRKRVLFVLSMQGGRVLAGGEGTAADAMIRLAGAENAASGFQGYKPMTDEALVLAAPDAILMMASDQPEGESRIGASQGELAAIPALANSPALRDGVLLRMDGLKLLGFGPRTGKAALELNAAIYGGNG